MSKQLTVRLADDLVEFIDQRVASGHATSRAAVVADAVAKARQLETAERDAAILAATKTTSNDLDGLAEYAVRTSLDDLA